MRLFGTDGIRGLAGEGPLAEGRTRRLGRAIAVAAGACADDAAGRRAVIGRDPRPSGEAIARGLASGFRAEGLEPVDAGIIPTPGVSYLVRDRGFALGLVISASHNPPAYNGVKVFAASGQKVSDAVQSAIEARYAELSDAGADTTAPLVPIDASARQAYAQALVRAGGGRGALCGLELVCDCANGATGEAARTALGALGCDVTWIASDGDGARINDGVGALHPEVCARAVAERGAQAGFSFDGDGDRVIAVCERGEVHDGDALLYALARALDARGELVGRRLAVTVMSNLGLELALAAHGIGLVRTPVGDRHVTRALVEDGLALGGEQSGHIILPRAVGPTGDGLACAVTLLRLARASDRDAPFSSFLEGFERLPQEARKVAVGRKPRLEEVHGIPAGHRRRIVPANSLASLLIDDGRFDEAGEILTSLRASAEEALGGEHELVGTLSCNLGELRLRQGQLARAEPWFFRCADVLGKLHPGGHRSLSRPTLGLGRIRLRQGRPEAAEPYLRQALEIRTAALPAEHPRIAEARRELEGCLAMLGEEPSQEAQRR